MRISKKKFFENFSEKHFILTLIRAKGMARMWERENSFNGGTLQWIRSTFLKRGGGGGPLKTICQLCNPVMTASKIQQQTCYIQKKKKNAACLS